MSGHTNAVNGWQNDGGHDETGVRHDLKSSESHLKPEKRRQKNLSLFFGLPFSADTIVLLATHVLPLTSSRPVIYRAILTVSKDRVSFLTFVRREQDRDGSDV